MIIIYDHNVAEEICEFISNGDREEDKYNEMFRKCADKIQLDNHNAHWGSFNEKYDSSKPGSSRGTLLGPYESACIGIPRVRQLQ